MFRPKVLNRTNSGYGSKLSTVEWKAAVGNVLGEFWTGVPCKSIRDRFDEGDYHAVIALSLKRLNRFTHKATLDRMTEADLANFYYLGLAYYRIGETENAIACLHIVGSQNRFVQCMEVGFSDFVEMAHSELRKMSRIHGYDLVQTCNPDKYLERAIQRKVNILY